MRRAIGLALLGLAIAGCGTAPLGDIQPTASPLNDSTSGLACEPISLRAPDGNPVFLSGTWSGAADPNAIPKPSVFYLTQTNDCLVWVGLSAEEGEALGASWIETFHGTIRSDFLIGGRWTEVLSERVPGGRGAITVAVEFVPIGETYETELRLLDSIGDAHLVKRWVWNGTGH